MNRFIPGAVLFLAMLGSVGQREARCCESFAPDVLSPDATVAAQSIAALRGQGPQGLDVLLSEYDANHDARLLPAIDAVAAQHDAIWSRLYWYTDLEQAKSAAKVQGKPILYLRLMGRLTDEYSCANSRFFRTVLYANKNVSRVLRERFILVWESERPVPVVTIDYGDGRVLKRTLTGNSIHYVLDGDGGVIDALPGLYDPARFISVLAQAQRSIGAGYGDASRTRYLEQQDQRLTVGWEANMAAIGAGPVQVKSAKAAGANPAAGRAMRLAVSKSAVEQPLLAGITPGERDRAITAATSETWEKLATLHLREAQLDPNSVALIQSQNPTAYRDPKVLDQTLEKFCHLVALDTVHNEFEFRRQILGWLRQSPGISLEDLNRRVYSELFLTPRTDPWLGLTSPSTYSALPCDGCQTAVASH